MKKILFFLAFLIYSAGFCQAPIQIGGIATTSLTAGSGVTLNQNANSYTVNATGTGGTVTSYTVATANGVSATVTNNTTTPVATYSLGAITPSSVSTNTFTLAGVTTTTTTGTGAVVLATSPTFSTSITAPIIYGSSLSAGNLQLISTSHATLGSIFLGSNIAEVHSGTNTKAFVVANGITGSAYNLNNTSGDTPNICELVSDSGGTEHFLRISGYGIDGGSPAPGIHTFAYRGTSANPRALQSGDKLWTHGMRGFANATTQSSGAIEAYTTQNWTSSNQGSYINFQTTTNNTDATQRHESLRIDHDGTIYIGGVFGTHFNSGTDFLQIEKDQNANTSASIINASAGTAARAFLACWNNAGTPEQINMGITSTTWTNDGIQGTQAAYLQTAATNGLNIGTRGTQQFSLWTNNIKRVGVIAGGIQLYGTTSGSVTIVAPIAAGTPTVTLPGSTGTLALTSDILTLAAGTYTPTLTSVANLDATGAFQCQYMRVGNTVTVSGVLTADPTAAVATEVDISLPIASDITAAENVGGATGAVAIASQSGGVSGDATNNRAALRYVATSTANASMYFTFTYLIQ